MLVETGSPFKINFAEFWSDTQPTLDNSRKGGFEYARVPLSIEELGIKGSLILNRDWGDVFATVLNKTDNPLGYIGEYFKDNNDLVILSPFLFILELNSNNSESGRESLSRLKPSFAYNGFTAKAKLSKDGVYFSIKEGCYTACWLSFHLYDNSEAAFDHSKPSDLNDIRFLFYS